MDHRLPLFCRIPKKHTPWPAHCDSSPASSSVSLRSITRLSPCSMQYSHRNYRSSPTL